MLFCQNFSEDKKEEKMLSWKGIQWLEWGYNYLSKRCNSWLGVLVVKISLTKVIEPKAVKNINQSTLLRMSATIL